MIISRRKRAAACLLVIEFLEECTEDESGERWWKRGRTREWIRRINERGMLKLVEELRVDDTAAYKEMLRMNCETFEEILTAIGPVITKHQVEGGHRVISPAARLTLTLRFLIDKTRLCNSIALYLPNSYKTCQTKTKYKQ